MHPVAGSAEHWDDAYRHGVTTRSWFQDTPAMSLHMLEQAGSSTADSLIDIGGGASTLVDSLLGRGYRDLSVLDVSAVGLHGAQQRLGPAAERVHWLVTDLLSWQPRRTYTVWHDRAVFHFLTDSKAKDRYLQALIAATTADSLALFATFAPDGPHQCSGLPVARYSATELATTLGDQWKPVAEDREEHNTPGATVQPFTWAAFRRQNRPDP